MNLDSLLVRIRTQVTPNWYEFGLAVGVAEEVLNSYSGYPPEECIVEMLDHWLRNNDAKSTWNDVADGLRKIGLHELAESTRTGT